MAGRPSGKSVRFDAWVGVSGVSGGARFAGMLLAPRLLIQICMGCMCVGGGNRPPPRHAARPRTKAMNKVITFVSGCVPAVASCWARIVVFGVVLGFLAAVVIPVHVH